MKLYVTYSDKEKLKKTFLNLRKQLIIDSFEVASSLGYTSENLTTYSYFIINEKIKKKIQSTSASNRMQSIIYINKDMNDELIRNIINFAQLKTSIEKVVFLTEKGQQEELYELFEEVVFFPTAKKIHIIKCEPLTF